MVWNTPSGTRMLAGAERAVYVDCVISLLDAVFTSAAAPAPAGTHTRSRERAARKATPAYAHDSVGFFYTLASVDALLVLKAVCEALLTDVPEPEVSSLYEAAAFAPIKHRATTFVASESNCVLLALQAREVLQGARIRDARDEDSTDAGDAGDADDAGDAGDEEDVEEILAILAGDVQPFFFEHFTDGIFWDTDFENEEVFAQLGEAKRARMMTSIGPDYKEQGARQLRALRAARCAWCIWCIGGERAVRRAVRRPRCRHSLLVRILNHRVTRCFLFSNKCFQPKTQNAPTKAYR